jgi:uncharacterized membrane protein YeaQ/YmgE (transglycosylase-associated protein family)
MFVTIILGIVGALLGGGIGRAMGWYGPNEPAGSLKKRWTNSVK